MREWEQSKGAGPSVERAQTRELARGTGAAGRIRRERGEEDHRRSKRARGQNTRAGRGPRGCDQQVD